MGEIRKVQVSVPAKVLRKLPRPILTKLRFWVHSVETIGLHEVRKQPGYHDEPLRGERVGQRCIRLSQAYRAIYVLRDGEVECVDVLEVHKHRY